jgi:hypothetical protein
MGHAGIARMRDSEAVSINEFVVREFRLHAAEGADQAARIVATFPVGLEPSVPLLRSIDDERDVAIVGALHVGEQLNEREQRAALGSLVASWRPVKRYGPRISESTESAPSSYRLAVTESGINDQTDPPDPPDQTDQTDEPAVARREMTWPTGPAAAPTTHVGLMWVGAPLESYAGLMVLLGSDDDQNADRPDARDWPLTLSRQLQVRIYETPR